MVYKLVYCKNKNDWNKFVISSPQANIFCCTDFLDSLLINYDLLWVMQKNIPQLGVIVLRNKDQIIKSPYPFSMYQGIIFSNYYQCLSIHKKTIQTLKVTDFLLAEMEKRYNLISFCLHYKIEDLRSFQWFNYHQPEKGQFTTGLRYTGLINLNKIGNFADYLSTIRSTRKYEYRKALKLGLKVERSEDIDELDCLHELTFARQGIKRTKKQRTIFKNIVTQALSKKYGEMLLCKNTKGRAISATLYLYDNQVAYYLFGANDPQYRHNYGGTFLMLENIKRCFDKKLALVDVCGINSPNRGDFKISFNALPTPYFEVTWEKPSKRL